jgi:hypothetical protein
VVGSPAKPVATPVVVALALALADADGPVLAVDGADGSLMRALCPDASRRQVGRPDRQAVASPRHHNLEVLDLSAGAWTARDGELLLGWDGVVLVDCPPLHDSRGVDLLSWCTGAVVLVGADDPVREHQQVVRWLGLTGTTLLGTVFTTRVRRGSRRRRRHRSRRVSTAPAGLPGLPGLPTQD